MKLKNTFNASKHLSPFQKIRIWAKSLAFGAAVILAPLHVSEACSGHLKGLEKYQQCRQISPIFTGKINAPMSWLSPGPTSPALRPGYCYSAMLGRLHHHVPIPDSQSTMFQALLSDKTEKRMKNVLRATMQFSIPTNSQETLAYTHSKWKRNKDCMGRTGWRDVNSSSSGMHVLQLGAAWF